MKKRMKGEMFTGLVVIWALIAAGTVAAMKSDSVTKKAEVEASTLAAK